MQRAHCTKGRPKRSSHRAAALFYIFVFKLKVMKQMAKKDTRMENHINGTVGCVHHLRIQNVERAVGAEIFPACRLRIDSSIM